MEQNYVKMSAEYLEAAKALEKKIIMLRRTAPRTVKWTHKENDKLAKRIALLNDMYMDCKITAGHLKTPGTGGMRKPVLSLELFGDRLQLADRIPAAPTKLGIRRCCGYCGAPWRAS